MRTIDGHSRRTRIKGLGLHAGLLLLVVSVALLAAGCRIQIGLDTVVKENGSGTFGLRLAADKEIQDLMAQQGGGEDLFSGLKEGMPEGWTTEEGTDPDGTKWVKATVAFKDQEELKSLLQSGGDSPMGDLGDSQIEISQTTSLFSVNTRFAGKFDMGSALSAIGEGAGEEAPMEMLQSIIQFENRVTLPGSIKSHNADEVQGNTLVWRPKGSGMVEMTAESSALRWGVVGGFIGGGVVLVALIIALIIIMVRRGRRTAPAAPPMAAAAAAVTATAPGVEASMPSTPPFPAPEAPEPPAADDVLPVVEAAESAVAEETASAAQTAADAVEEVGGETGEADRS